MTDDTFNQKELRRFKRLKIDLSYRKFCKIYPVNYGRIDCRQGFLISAGKYYHDAAGFVMVGFTSKSTADPRRVESKPLDRFKNVIHLLRQLKNTKGDAEHLHNLLQDKKFSSEDTILYREIYEYFSTKKGLRIVDSILSRAEFLPPRESMGEKEFKVWRRLFRQRSDYELYKKAAAFLENLMCQSDIPHYGLDKISKDIHETLEPLRIKKAQLVTPSRRLSKCLNVLSNQLSHKCYGIFRGIHAPRREWPLSTLNWGSLETMINHVDCCITGPNGESREASILYSLDKSVHVWCIDPATDYKPYTRCLGLFVEARGYHVSNPEDKKKYLVLEGFPANQKDYLAIGKVDILTGTVINKKSVKIPEVNSISFAQLVYMLGLATACARGIDKMFINVVHSDRQQSVDDAVRESALQSGLKEREMWHNNRHDRFRLFLDPYTNDDFENYAFGNYQFEYTHFLKKPPLSSKLTNLLKLDAAWSGEGFFDTWYQWNDFIMKTHAEWPDNLKKEHPYAEAVFKRGKDPQWNLGIGYCKGFEVDVEKECKRLGIS